MRTQAPFPALDNTSGDGRVCLFPATAFLPLCVTLLPLAQYILRHRRREMPKSLYACRVCRETISRHLCAPSVAHSANFRDAAMPENKEKLRRFSRRLIYFCAMLC